MFYAQYKILSLNFYLKLWYNITWNFFIYFFIIVFKEELCEFYLKPDL